MIFFVYFLTVRFRPVIYLKTISAKCQVAMIEQSKGSEKVEIKRLKKHGQKIGVGVFDLNIC